MPLLKGKLSSYRLILNFTTVSKIIQRLVLNRLRPHLLASPCFARLQSAYRCGHSTETALLHVMNSVYADAEKKEATILVGLDISAAFDAINHGVLISRFVNQFGVDGEASGWPRSYLTDRSQCVKLGEHSSATIRGASLASLKGRC